MRPVLALCCCMVLAPCLLFADGVTRSVKPVSGGCKVTLAWTFSGTVESDFIIEERFAQGWSVDDSTVPFSSLDASWFSGCVARFAVKPTLLSKAGSISFTVVCGEGTASGTVSGDWKMYLGGKLKKGTVAGQNVLSALVVTPPSDEEPGASGSGTSGSTSTTVVETPLAITSFEMSGGVFSVLSYSSLAKSGTLVVEGCEGLNKPWKEIKRVAVSVGDKTVKLDPGEVGGCCFLRLKLLTEGK